MESMSKKDDENEEKKKNKNTPKCRYKAERVIGKGSFGIVFQVYEVEEGENEDTDYS